MCHSLKILAKVNSGELSVCSECNTYHLEFNNLYFEFDFKQYKQFKTYLLTINESYWEQKYACSNLKRKIPIPSTQPNLVLVFKRQEIKELKSLFFKQNHSYKNLLGVDDIDYKLILN